MPSSRCLSASSTRDVTVVFWLTLLVYLLFTVGYRTRLFQIISFILVTSLHSRNLLTELPSDIPLHLFLAWSLVMPLGARFSIDNVRKSLRQVEETSPAELNQRTPLPRTFTSVAIFGILLQLAVIEEDAVALVAACREVKLLAARDVVGFIGSESARGHRAHQNHRNKGKSHRGAPALPTL